MKELQLKDHFLPTIQLAIPVIIGQVSSLLMTVTDNLMVGRLGETTLSAASLGASCFILVAILGIGCTNAIPSLVAEARGAANLTELERLKRNVSVFGLLNGIITFFLVTALWAVLPLLGQPAVEVALAGPFMFILGLSAIPAHFFLSLKGFFDGMGKTKIGMYLSIFGVVLNICLNYLLIFGFGPVPALGLVGSALATLTSRILQALIIMLLYFYHPLSKINPSTGVFSRFDTPILGKMLRLGFPMGLQIFFELAAFSGAAIMLGWLPDASVARASHQMAINMASLTFMFAFGFAVAGSVRVGEAFGRQSQRDMHNAGLAVLLIGSSIMALLGLFLYAIRFQIAPLYGFKITDAVFITTAQLMVIAAVFQVVDGAQCIGAGLLRGIQDVKIPTWITFFAYWVLWMPLAYWMCFSLNWGVSGVWWADVAALGVAAVLLNSRFFYLLRQPKTMVTT